MKNSSRLSSRSVKALVTAAAVLLPTVGVMADTIYIATKGSNKPPLARAGLTITKIDKGDDGEVLSFTTAGGNTSTKKLDDIVQIEADNEPIFNQAEAEFAKNDLQAASDDYRKAISSSTKEWVKHRADVRLLFISGKTGDFLGAVTGFVELAKKDPSSAAARKPAIPANSTQLASAIAAVNAAMGTSTVEAKQAVYPFLADLYLKNNDPDNATRILGIIKKLSPTKTVNPAAPANLPDSNGADELAAKQVAADIAMNKANTAFAAHDYPSAIATINAASASFIDPDHQAKALYLIAQSKAATATTPDALEEAAMAYMRVVAHFRSQADPSADALYQTGVIEEKLNKIADAKLIYQQVSNEYKDAKAAQDAKAALARLK